MFKRSQIVNGLAVFLIGSGIIWMLRRAAAKAPQLDRTPAAAPGGSGPNFVPERDDNPDILEI